jgi:hypothetical protein
MNLSNQLFLAAEDRLGLALGHRLVKEQASLQVWRELNGHGFGNLKRDVKKYDQMARYGLPILMLTDLDRRPCCTDLLDFWLGKGKKPHSNFLLRIVVREAETWLLADPVPLAKLFKLPVSKFTTQPESLPDPRIELLRLASKAPSKIRKALLPARGSSAKIGIEYNDVLCPLVANEWNIADASRHAPSLIKARMRIHELALRIVKDNKAGGHL